MYVMSQPMYGGKTRDHVVERDKKRQLILVRQFLERGRGDKNRQQVLILDDLRLLILVRQVLDRGNKNRQQQVLILGRFTAADFGPASFGWGGQKSAAAGFNPGTIYGSWFWSGKFWTGGGDKNQQQVLILGRFTAADFDPVGRTIFGQRGQKSAADFNPRTIYSSWFLSGRIKFSSRILS